MQCPYCNALETKVTNKRDSDDVTRRRRECLKCSKRFTTYERFELDLNVIKKDGKRERFNRTKVYEGVCKSLEKRPFLTKDVEDVVDEIEAKIYKVAKDKNIKNSKIGEIVMAKLKKIDNVAYIRFASVYRDFKDVDDFKKELKGLK